MSTPHELGSTAKEASSLVSGDRLKEYGNPSKVYSIASTMCGSMFGIGITSEEIIQVLIAVKFARHNINNNKHDNMVDACGYIDILEHMRNPTIEGGMAKVFKEED